MKKLCFGSFVKILTLCKVHGVTQKQLCGTILLSVAPEYDIRSEDGNVSRLVCCTRNLSSYVTSLAPMADIHAISEYFKSHVMPLLDDNKKKLAVLALKDIIASDDMIDSDTLVEKNRGLTKANVIDRTSFVLYEFLAGIFYTATTMKNTEGKDFVRDITPEYLARFEAYKDAITVTALEKTNANVKKRDEITQDSFGYCRFCREYSRYRLTDEEYKELLLKMRQDDERFIASSSLFSSRNDFVEVNAQMGTQMRESLENLGKRLASIRLALPSKLSLPAIKIKTFTRAMLPHHDE